MKAWSTVLVLACWGCAAQTSGQLPMPVATQSRQAAYTQIVGQLQAPGRGDSQLAGAQVMLENTGIATQADAQGRFDLQNVPLQADQHLIANKVLADGTTLSLRTPLATGSAQLDLQSLLLSESGSVYGKVGLDTQQDLTGVNVFLAGTSLGALSDAEGNFFLANVPAGEYNLTALKSGYALAQQPVKIEAGKPTQRSFSLRSLDQTAGLSSSISGVISTKTGPLSGVTVGLAGEAILAVTDNAGRYHLPQLPLRDKHSLLVSKPGFVFQQLEITLKAGQQLEKNLELQAEQTVLQGQLTGTLSDNAGQPLAQAEVETIPATQKALTDNQGHFRIPDVLPGAYYLIGKLNGQIKASRFIGLEPGQTVQVPLQGLVITGDNAQICDQQNINNININIPGAQVTVTVNNQNSCTIDGKPTP